MVLVNFAEKGHSQTIQPKKTLPAEVARLVREWVKAGKDAAEFFSVNPELELKADEYDLSEFKKE
jgi:hypothetical protein